MDICILARGHEVAATRGRPRDKVRRVFGELQAAHVVHLRNKRRCTKFIHGELKPGGEAQYGPAKARLVPGHRSSEDIIILSLLDIELAQAGARHAQRTHDKHHTDGPAAPHKARSQPRRAQRVSTLHKIWCRQHAYSNEWCCLVAASTSHTVLHGGARRTVTTERPARGADQVGHAVHDGTAPTARSRRNMR